MSSYLPIRLLVNLHNSVHYWNISVFDFKYYYLANADWVVLIIEKQDIATLEGRLH